VRERVAAAFREAAAGLGIHVAPATIDELVGRYGEAHRRHHGLGHVVACIAAFDAHRGLAARPAEVLAALLFHDAVYDPRRSDNEARSAAVARRALAGASQDAVDRIAEMIYATAGHVANAASDTALVLDVDLAILGAPREVYDTFERGVREEYEFVDDATFRAARTAVLSSFLARPAIYNHAPFRAAFEARARENLTRVSRATQ
jgi:predicted metal-dependent HD superfamily phosphohydrolase